MDIRKILSHVDHTLLTPTATAAEIGTLCREAAAYGTAAVCVPPAHVRRAAGCLAGTGVKVCTVIGFPNGYSTTAVKCFETAQAVRDGADEADMVIDLGWAREGRWDLVEDEIRQVKSVCGGRTLKVIVEACLLTEGEKISACRAVTAAGADYIKTSTGFSAGGATFADVELLAREVGSGVRVKAAGGIATLEDAARFLEIGADRLGTSRVVRLVQELEGVKDES